MKSGCGEHKLEKKRGLTWESRLLPFQSPTWESEKNGKIKSWFLMFARMSAEKESADDFHTI